jgi:hypothetical protein
VHRFGVGDVEIEHFSHNLPKVPHLQLVLLNTSFHALVPSFRVGAQETDTTVIASATSTLNFVLSKLHERGKKIDTQTVSLYVAPLETTQS